MRVEVEHRVVGRDEKTNDENTPNVKQQNSIEYPLDCLWDVPARILRFSGCYLVRRQEEEEQMG